MVATQDIGDLGVHDSQPATIAWRWYYHVPGLGLWGVLLALLVVMPSNRHTQAWLIWLPILAVPLGWSLLARLLFMSPQTAEPIGAFLGTLAGAWATVWLLAPWLARRRMLAALTSALIAMLAAGCVYYFGTYGMDLRDEAIMLGVLYVGGSLTLLVATVLGAYFCRRAYRPRRLLAWLLLWTIVVPAFTLPLVILGSALFWGGGLAEVAGMLLMALLSSLVGSGALGLALYLVNLPFLTLAFRNPFFAARFQQVLRLPDAGGNAMDGGDAADSGDGANGASAGQAIVPEVVLAAMVEEP